MMTTKINKVSVIYHNKNDWENNNEHSPYKYKPMVKPLSKKKKNDFKVMLLKEYDVVIL